jgi:hypothetical protein
MEDHVVCLNLT